MDLVMPHQNSTAQKIIGWHNLFRMVWDRIEAELRLSRGSEERGAAEHNTDFSTATELWTPETFLLERHSDLGQSCLNLDSYERIQVASSLSLLFQLNQWNAGDNLLRMRRLGDVCQLIADCIHSPEQSWQALCFESSGSMGPPRAITKTRQEMEAECESWRALLDGGPGCAAPRRILSLVPAHHLYGFIWTVLLPESYAEISSDSLEERCGVPVVDARHWGAARWASELQPGDWIVAFPFRWENWLRLAPSIPPGVGGISSAGALTPQLWTELKHKGLSRLIEVYGSSESGGVATRESSGAPFDLAPHWRARQQDLARLLPDEIESAGPGRFHLLGRKDGSVKIRGVLVSLPEVEHQLREHPLVSDCRLRLRHRSSLANAEPRLEALIIPTDPHQDEAEIQAQLHRDLFSGLGAAAWPRHFVFASKLPLNSLGKAVNW
jgi:long-chain acyl-CoA synthetase